MEMIHPFSSIYAEDYILATDGIYLVSNDCIKYDQETAVGVRKDKWMAFMANYGCIDVRDPLGNMVGIDPDQIVVVEDVLTDGRTATVWCVRFSFQTDLQRHAAGLGENFLWPLDSRTVSDLHEKFVGESEEDDADYELEDLRPTMFAHEVKGNEWPNFTAIPSISYILQQLESNIWLKK